MEDRPSKHMITLLMLTMAAGFSPEEGRAMFRTLAWAVDRTRPERMAMEGDVEEQMAEEMKQVYRKELGRKDDPRRQSTN